MCNLKWRGGRQSRWWLGGRDSGGWSWKGNSSANSERLSHKHDKMDGLIMKNSFSSPDHHHQGSFAAAVVVVGFIYINAGRTRKEPRVGKRMALGHDEEDTTDDYGDGVITILSVGGKRRKLNENYTLDD